MVRKWTSRFALSAAVVLVIVGLKVHLDRLPNRLPTWNGFTEYVENKVGTQEPASGPETIVSITDASWAEVTAVPEENASATTNIPPSVIATTSSSAPTPTVEPHETLSNTIWNLIANEGSPEDKIVVMGKTKDEDTSWVAEKLQDWQHAIYSVDDTSASLHTFMNKGHEANPYLTYITDHYDKLPSTIAFVHSHEAGYPKAWHTDSPSYSNVNSLHALNIDFVQRNGFANLRCIGVPGCPDELQPFREPYEDHRTAEHAYSDVWKYVFNNTDIPRTVATPCCAQFAVSKKQVQSRPREFYVRALQFLRDTELDDDTSGRVFEYMWHIMFGQKPVYCPSLQQCYADVYNRRY